MPQLTGTEFPRFPLADTERTQTEGLEDVEFVSPLTVVPFDLDAPH